MRFACWGLTLGVLLGLAPSLGAQETPESEGMRVFLDCQGGRCDFNYFRTEITWVNWVRDRSDAEVHLLITTQSTGGGREYTFRFIGLNAQRGRDDELKAPVSNTATEDEERRIIARSMKLGLVRYAAHHPVAGRLGVTYTAPTTSGPAQQPRDPWNFWVFRAGVNGFFNGESRSNGSFLSGSLRATRTTDAWKLRFGVNGNRSSNSFTLSDGSKFNSVSSTSGGEALVVRSLSQHWSFGLQTRADRSDPQNLDLSVRTAPGIEFNVWPYSQSTRRQLTFLYEIGLTRVNYADTTIFGKLTDNLSDQRLSVSLITREPWGSSRLSLTGATYFQDLGKNRLVASGGVNFRVVRGLDLNLSGSYSRVRDQLFLPKAGATDEQILLRLRQLQTAYRYSASIGFSYTFGSIYNNIVNPRFGGAGGGGEIFFF